MHRSAVSVWRVDTLEEQPLDKDGPLLYSLAHDERFSERARFVFAA